MDHYKDIQTIANILFVAENYGKIESNELLEILKQKIKSIGISKRDGITEHMIDYYKEKKYDLQTVFKILIH
jgi:hypothetical protein